MIRTTIATFFLTFQATVLSVTASAQEADKNLVANPSFEDVAANGLASNWIAHKSYALSDEIHLDGSNSMVASGDDVYYCGAYTVIDVPQPGCKLQFTSNIYVSEFSKGIIKPIHVSYEDGNGKKFYQPHINLYPGDDKIKFNEWVEYNCVLDLSKKPEVKKVLFWCLGYHDPKKEEKFTGKVYWDAVAIRVVE